MNKYVPLFAVLLTLGFVAACSPSRPVPAENPNNVQGPDGVAGSENPAARRPR